MESYIADWLNLLMRWLHIIAGIAWIGAWFYFVWLDDHLTKPKDPDDAARCGLHGEPWAVHGGGFYNAQKFLLGPKDRPLPTPEHLHWFKWEAYTTWFSGMGMLAIVYWWGANAYLIDKSVMDLSVSAAIAISAITVMGSWVIYDALCKLVKNDVVLGVILYVLIVAAAWGYGQVFGARAAYMHVGAMVGTWMVWSVMIHVIPGQRRMVEAIRAGKAPNPIDGAIGKQRSVQNTYFTLPVLLIMISSRYPLTYGHQHGWAVLAVIMLAGALIRRFYVLRHFGRTVVWLPVVAVAMLLARAVAIAPRATAPSAAPGAAVSYAAVQPIIVQRCTVCHAEKPSFAGFQQPPGGLRLETPEQVKAAADQIHKQTIATQAMPIGNLTKMTDEERALLGRWLAAGAPIN
jgi:uncharacterized membrane protein